MYLFKKYEYKTWFHFKVGLVHVNSLFDYLIAGKRHRCLAWPQNGKCEIFGSSLWVIGKLSSKIFVHIICRNFWQSPTTDPFRIKLLHISVWNIWQVYLNYCLDCTCLFVSLDFTTIRHQHSTTPPLKFQSHSVKT